MRLKSIISHFETGSYALEQRAFDGIVDGFEKRGNVFEPDWRRVDASETRVVFVKGASVSMTFNYADSTAPEVKVIFEYSPDSKALQVSVGNSGFPFESFLARKRYARLFAGIDRFIRERS